MLSLALSQVNPYVAFAAVAIFWLPVWGRMVLRFLRDLNDYRAHYRKR